MYFWIREEGSGKKFTNGNIDLYYHYKNIPKDKMVPYSLPKFLAFSRNNLKKRSMKKMKL